MAEQTIVVGNEPLFWTAPTILFMMDILTVTLTPYGYMHRYDLVIEDADGHFWKIQCKTAWLSTQTEGALVFAGCSTGVKGGWEKRGYQNDVDYFAVYSPDTDKVYLVAAEGIGNQCSLRLTPSKNMQEKHVRYATDYEL